MSTIEEEELIKIESKDELVKFFLDRIIHS